VVPAMEHDHCYRIYNPRTNAERTSDTVQFFPTHSKMPKLSSADAALRAVKDLIAALKNPHPAAPFDQLGDQQLRALKDLAKIFDTTLPRVTPGKQLPSGTPSQPSPSNQPKPPPLPSPRHRYPTRQHSAAAATLLTSQQAFPSLIPEATVKEMIEAPPELQCPLLPMANAVINPVTGSSMDYRELITNAQMKNTWLRSSANEFGRLAQGVGQRIKGTGTIFFIP
jgi:hypothetical protein